jgi:predicted TIM-barrel fold metal-dependent hydrolase
VEARYALDTLHADRVVLLANSEGAYLGDASFEPLVAELNARQAVIFVHRNDLPSSAIDGIPAFAADFLLDTTRAVILLTKSGAMTRHPDLKIILAHAGGFVPYTAYRFALVVSDEHTSDSGIALLKNVYFDAALLDVAVGPSQFARIRETGSHHVRLRLVLGSHPDRQRTLRTLRVV